MGDIEAAGRFHELTKHEPGTGGRAGLVRFRPLDPANRPTPFKRYLHLPVRPLASEVAAAPAPALDVLAGRWAPPLAAVDARSVARLLFFAAGVTRSAGGSATRERTWFRAAMSAGNLHPVEVYLVCDDLPGVGAGVHHFAPLEFGLTPLRTGDARTALAAAAADPEIASAPCTLVLTGLPWRTAWKYGERGFRHLYWDCGTLLANLLAVAQADGLGARVLLGFVDDDVSRVVGVDGVSEFPLALVVVGRPDQPSHAATVTVDPLDVDVEPISPRPITFPLVVQAQEAGALRTTEAVTAWRDAARQVGERATTDVPSPEHGDGPSLDEVILRRGSTRLMRRAPVAHDLLAWGLAAASRPLPVDVGDEGTTLVHHDLSVHHVDGLQPGAYRWRSGHLALLRAGDLRGVAERLCLAQPLGGDAAFTAFHMSDVDEVLAVLSSRGYRACQIEAGVAAGRLALAAFALGYGATGLTFFDDEVARFFATTAACMLVTAVGVPAYRNTPGGLPGQARELAGYDRLMQQLTLQLNRPRRR